MNSTLIISCHIFFLLNIALSILNRIMLDNANENFENGITEVKPSKRLSYIVEWHFISSLFLYIIFIIISYPVLV